MDLEPNEKIEGSEFLPPSGPSAPLPTAPPSNEPDFKASATIAEMIVNFLIRIASTR